LAFWRNPSRDFCQNVLGLRLPADDHVEEGQEPVAVDPLTQSRIGDRLLTASTDSDFETALRIAAASGELPPGITGDAALGRLRRDAERILPNRDQTSHSLDFELEGKRWRLTGALERVGAGGLMFASLTNLKAWRRVAAWIHHVVLNAAACESELSVARVTTLIGRDGSWVFDPIDEPATVLDMLVNGYRLGREQPLPFSDEASLAFAKKSRGPEPAPRQDCLDAAILSWGSVRLGGMKSRTEPYCALAFRGQAPLSDDRELFAGWAESIFGPLLTAMRKT
jgi:exodeoxyribonuclease V gamma subunit